MLAAVFNRSIPICWKLKSARLIKEALAASGG
jgi:hypothetical protein